MTFYIEADHNVSKHSVLNVVSEIKTAAARIFYLACDKFKVVIMHVSESLN